MHKRVSHILQIDKYIQNTVEIVLEVMLFIDNIRICRQTTFSIWFGQLYSLIRLLHG